MPFDGAGERGVIKTTRVRGTSARQRRVLDIVASDRTFELVEYGGRPAWAGKCIHCNRRVLVSEDGELLGSASIEHIVPRTHAGSNDLANLAIACKGCNREKGVRHDHRPRNDPKLVEIIERLLRRRRERWRHPGAGTAPRTREE
jgi:5-methylcytosine-specific restriction endonuclease McrA